MKTLAIIAAIVAAAYVGFQIAYPTVVVRYRLTLEASTPEGVKSGSGVIEVTFAKRPVIIPEMQWVERWVRGQAVMLDLGQRGVLFATLEQGQNWHSLPKEVLTFAYWGRNLQHGDNIRSLKDLRGRKNLPVQLLPMLVRFRDLTDPTTVEQVDPNVLAKSFGPDIRLTKASVEITDDPVTKGIEVPLPWLANGGSEKWLVTPHGELSTGKPAAHRLTFADFRSDW
jgi:hypothetical protein